MTYELACWLAAKLDIFDLKVRGGKTKKGRANNDLYYSSGWAHGYKQAQTDARKASRGPRLPKAGPVPTELETICESDQALRTGTCEKCGKEWKVSGPPSATISVLAFNCTCGHVTK